jgi:hypothetical protein
MDAQLDRVAFDAFLLGIRVMSLAFELDKPASEFEKPFEMLRDIATGRLTAASPAELGMRFPQLKELIYDAAPSIMERDRETAGRVLRGLSSSL